VLGRGCVHGCGARSRVCAHSVGYSVGRVRCRHTCGVCAKGVYELARSIHHHGGHTLCHACELPVLVHRGHPQNTFFAKTMHPAELIKTLVQFTQKARREGLLALEDEAASVEDAFLSKGVQLVVDGTDPELVRSILETELSFLENRHRTGAAMFETMASLAPSFGMVGTLIGLIQMMGTLDDPEKIGPGMAVALVTTFYGTILANLVFTPLAGKLKVRSAEEILLREVMIEGILSIQAGDNPRIVEEKLNAFLAPKVRFSGKSRQMQGVGETTEARAE